MYIDTKYIKYAAVLLALVLLCVGAYMLVDKYTYPPIKEVSEVSVPEVKKALEDSGVPVSNKDAGEIVDKIQYRVAKTEPDYKATVESEKKADETAKQLGKKDNADTVIKEKKPNPQDATKTDMYYYGISMEKKTNGLGLYTDLTKDGSYGIHARHDKLIVQVGKKKSDGSVTGRVAYEAIQW